MIAAKPIITNLALTSNAVEYAYAIPTGVNRIEIKLRDGSALLYVRFVSGGNYITVPYGASYSETDMKGGITIYLQSDTDSMVAEIKVWK